MSARLVQADVPAPPEGAARQLPVSTAKVEESLRQLVKDFTIVIAPHNVQQAGRIADRVAFLLGGKLIETGETARVFTNPSDKRTGDYVEGRFG